jgi:formate/nitrite transporter FocA (FNT family)
MENKFQIKQKKLINRLAFAFAIILLCNVFSACGTTRITIQWAEIWKTIGLVILGVVIGFAILVYIFRNFRVW